MDSTLGETKKLKDLIPSKRGTTLNLNEHTKIVPVSNVPTLNSTDDLAEALNDDIRT